MAAFTVPMSHTWHSVSRTLQ